MADRSSPTHHKLLSACAGAFATSILVTPLDVVKTRLQSQIAAESSHAVRINGVWHGFYTITRHEGPARLWRGVVPTLTMAVPSTALYMVAYDMIREYQPPPSDSGAVSWLPRDDKIRAAYGGAVARVATTVLMSPIELVRTRMQQVGTAEETALPAVLRSVLKMTQTYGVGSLWRGVGATILRDVPFSGIYWYIYESMRPVLHNAYQRADLFQTSPIHSELGVAFVAAAAAGTIAAAATTPFDVLKTRRQMEMAFVMDNLNTKRNLQPPIFLHIFKSILAEEGWKGCWKGLAPRIAKVAPACAVMISSYEVGKQILGE